MYMERMPQYPNAAAETFGVDSRAISAQAYRRAYARARELRAQEFARVGGAAWRALTAPVVRLWRRLNCERLLHRAERELNALTDETLRDIGVSRSEIPWRVRAQSPRGGRF